MNDEIFDRTYQAGRADLNAGIDRGLQRIGAGIASRFGKSFEVFHRIQWSAPWASNSNDARCG